MSRTFCLALLLLFFGAASMAQDAVLNDPVSSTLFSSSKYSGVNGTPFLNTKWTPGSVTISRGTYPRLDIKLDVYSNILYFRVGDEAYEFQDPVIRFVMMPVPADSSSYQYFIRGKSGPSLKSDQFVEVLASGKLSLYKSIIKSVTEASEINAGIIKNFNTATRYYMEKDGNLTLVRPNRKNELTAFMSDKAAEVESYIRAQHLNLREDADAAKLIKYYNSL